MTNWDGTRRALAAAPAAAQQIAAASENWQEKFQVVIARDTAPVSIAMSDRPYTSVYVDANFAGSTFYSGAILKVFSISRAGRSLIARTTIAVQATKDAQRILEVRGIGATRLEVQLEQPAASPTAPEALFAVTFRNDGASNLRTIQPCRSMQASSFGSAVTLSDAADQFTIPTKSVLLSADGTLGVIMWDDVDAGTIPGLKAGVLYPFALRRIRSTGTTLTDAQIRVFFD